MQEVINGDYLAASMNLIILRRKLTDIREMMKDRWDEIEKEKPNIPEWQRPITETFDFMLSQFVLRMREQGRFHEAAKEAGNYCFYKRLLELKNKTSDEL